MPACRSYEGRAGVQRLLDRHRARGHRYRCLRRPSVPGAGGGGGGALRGLSALCDRRAWSATATSRPGARPTRRRPSIGRCARRSIAAACAAASDITARVGGIHSQRAAARASIACIERGRNVIRVTFAASRNSPGKPTSSVGGGVVRHVGAAVLFAHFGGRVDSLVRGPPDRAQAPHRHRERPRWPRSPSR